MPPPNPKDGEKTSNKYMKKNSAQAKCPGNPALEKQILEQANHAGYHNVGEKSSKSKRKRAKQIASTTLIKLCKLNNCKPINPNGMYPHTMQSMNKHSQGKHPPRTRPKGYNFPQ